MKSLEYVTSLLAATTVLAFGTALAYCIVFLDGINLGLRKHLTFVDIVNTALATSPGAFLITLYVLMSFLLLHRQEKTNVWTSSLVSVIPVIVLAFVLISGFMMPYYREFGDLRVPMSRVSVLILCGFLISYTIAAAFSGVLRQRPFQFIAVLALPPVLAVMVSIAAARDSRMVVECKQPDTASYTTDVGRQSTPHHVCLILSLERGLLFYDKDVRAVVFMPWSQLGELKRQGQFGPPPA